MSSRIAVHVVAGILFVGVAMPDAQESLPRPAVVEVRDAQSSAALLPTRNDSSSLQNDMLEPLVAFRFDCVAGIEGDVGVTRSRVHQTLTLTIRMTTSRGGRTPPGRLKTQATHLRPRRAPVGDGSQVRC